MTDLQRWFPLGTEPKKELQTLLKFLIFSLFFACWCFFLRYYNDWSRLYETTILGKVLIEGQTVRPFSVLIQRVFLGFEITGIFYAALAISYYAKHYQGSKSIYLMKRLPNRWELWRRCLVFPAVAILLSIALTLVLWILFFCFYITVTPEGCLPGLAGF